ncbi:hypothetical protein FA13DRAFT_1716734 [Coprinellus micaceus]|uniref:Uncharacterized protein n=1 Tax=Coprinellus micaceus TaxID=71717 RepID=A0A4Y7SIH2_COPMI|nr:hypothetical protein FA13DRAFT_1716734 [Coprinellus micaceus]
MYHKIVIPQQDLGYFCPHPSRTLSNAPRQLNGHADWAPVNGSVRNERISTSSVLTLRPPGEIHKTPSPYLPEYQAGDLEAPGRLLGCSRTFDISPQAPRTPSRPLQNLYQLPRPATPNLCKTMHKFSSYNIWKVLIFTVIFTVLVPYSYRPNRLAFKAVRGKAIIVTHPEKAGSGVRGLALCVWSLVGYGRTVGNSWHDIAIGTPRELARN